MTQKPDINFAVIAPLGTDLDLLQEVFEAQIFTHEYKLETIKFTDLLKRFENDLDVKFRTKFERYEKYIKAGNQIVEKTGRKDILALGAVATAFDASRKRDKNVNVCKFFRQIKRPQEIDFLKQVYKDRIKFIGCYTPKNVRVEKIVNELRENSRGTGEDELRAKALSLIAIDENEKRKNLVERT